MILNYRLHLIYLETKDLYGTDRLLLAIDFKIFCIFFRIVQTVNI